MRTNNTLSKDCQMMVESWIEYIKRKKDLFIMVSGDVGAGKSNLCMGLSHWHICPTVGKPYQYEKMMYMIDKPELLRKLWYDNPRYTPIQVDEAVDNFFSLEWWKDESIDLQKSATKSRIGHKIVFLCIPERKQIQNFFRNSRVTFWIHIWNEGKATVLGKSKNIFASDRWYERYGEKLFRTKRVKTVGQAMRTISSHPCFITNLHYKFYNDPLWKIYLKDSAKAKRKGRETEKQRTMSANAFKRKRAMKLYDEMDKKIIADVLGITERTIYRWRKRYLAADN